MIKTLAEYMVPNNHVITATARTKIKCKKSAEKSDRLFRH